LLNKRERKGDLNHTFSVELDSHSTNESVRSAGLRITQHLCRRIYQFLPSCTFMLKSIARTTQQSLSGKGSD